MSTKKTVIVTGGSGGIGGGICRRLAADGWNVVVHYGSSEEEAKKVVSDITKADGSAIALSADVADEAQIADLFATTTSEFGTIDAVVANAGVGGGGPIVDSTLEDFDSVMRTNCRGAFLTLREAARQLTANGRIIFISSQLSERPIKGTGIYSASKASIDAMVVSMAAELGERGITVNSVLPGATAPGMFDDSNEEKKQKWIALSDLGRLGAPEDIAAVVAFLASDDGAWMTGQHLRADGGMSN